MRITLALAAVLVLAVAAPAEAARYAGRCKMPDRATVEAVGGRLLVFSLVHRDSDDDHFTRYHVCRRASGRRTLLVETLQLLGYTVQARHVSVAGGHVGYVRTEAGDRGSNASAVVYDAIRGRVREVRIGVEFVSGSYHRPEAVPAFVLNRRGVAAYVVRHHDDRDPQTLRPRERVGVRVFEAGGSRLLDKGDGIDPASLHIDATRVHWTNAGEARSAALR